MKKTSFDQFKKYIATSQTELLKREKRLKYFNFERQNES